jgi:hypothetical protein
MESIERRVAVLERGVRRWRMIAIALMAAAGLGVAAAREPAPAAPGRITAKEFVVIDADGKPVAILGSSAGAGGLTLFRAPSDVGCTLGPTADRNYLLTLLEKQKPTVLLGTYWGQPSPHLVLAAPNSKAEIRMTAGINDAAATFVNNVGKTPMQLLANEGGGVITIFNADHSAKWQAH